MRLEDRTFVQYIGGAGAGKTEVSRAMHERHGLKPFSVSTLLKSNAINSGRTLRERVDYRSEQDRYLETFGENAILEAIYRNNSDRMGIDGLRVPEFAFRLREIGSRSIIVALRCPLVVAHERIIKRMEEQGRDTSGLTLRAFVHEQWVDNHTGGTYKLDTGVIVAGADYIVDASQPLPDVIDEVSSIVTPLLAQ